MNDHEVDLRFRDAKRAGEEICVARVQSHGDKNKFTCRPYCFQQRMHYKCHTKLVSSLLPAVPYLFCLAETVQRRHLTFPLSDEFVFSPRHLRPIPANQLWRLLYVQACRLQGH